MAQAIRDILSQKQQLTKTIQPKSLSVSDIIKQEEADTVQSNTNKLNQYFSDRSDIRKSLSNGVLKTGRPAEDAFNVRTSKLIDLYLDNASKKTNDNGQPKFTTEQIINASKDIPGTLEKMKAYYKFNKPDKVWAIDDYIQKGGVATNVFEYLEDISGNITNPYGVKKETKTPLFEEGTPEVAKGAAAFGSFIPSMGERGVGVLAESKIGKWMDEKLYDTYHKVWDTASDEEYRKYKSGKEEGLNLDATNMGGVNKRQLYEAYDKALSGGFVGNIDEYKNFEKNIHKVTNNALNEKLKEGIISKDEMESSKGAMIGDALAELITYLSMPISEAIEIDTLQPILNTIATAGVDSIMNTLEFAALEGLQGDALSGEDVGDVGLINLLISGITRSPALAKYIKVAKDTKGGGESKIIRKFLSTLPEKVENAFKNMKSDTLENLWNMAKEEATNPEAQGTIRKWLGEKGVSAVEKLQTDITNLGRKYENKLSGLTEEVSEKGFFKDINDALSDLENQGALSWGAGKSPKLELKKEGNSYKMYIKNKKNLNKIKNEDGKGLGDAIEENVNSILEGYGIKLNKGSQYLIKQGVTNATKGTKWNVYEQQTRKLIEGIDNWDLNMPKEIKDLGTEIYNKKNLLSRTQKTLGIEGKYSAGKIGGYDRALEIAKAGKNMSNEDAVAMIDILKSEGYLPENIKSEIAAQGYLLGIENKNAGYSFLQGFYPSQAGEIEQVLELLRQKATAKDIENYIRLLRKQEEATQKASVGAGASAEIPQVSDAWRTMQKALGFGAGKTDLPQSQTTTEPQISKEEYDARFKSRYGKNL